MAHHILGVDLGTYSVKVMVVQPGLRHSTPVDYIERPVPAGDEAHEVRAARVLGQILRERKLDTDSMFLAAPGDKLFIHVLEFPFRTIKRTVLENAVGSELENVLPVDLEDMVFSFEALPGDMSGPAKSDVGDAASAAEMPGAFDDEPTNVQHGVPRPNVVHGRVAQPTGGMRMLTCAMEIDYARELLATLDTHAAEPRALVAAPSAYARVVERMSRMNGGASLGGRGIHAQQPVAVIDIGHERTDICVLSGGRVVYARTIKRGGRHLTDVLSRAWGVSFDEAERSKRDYGFIASAADPAGTREQERVHQVIAKEMGPLTKDIQRTLASCLAKTGVTAGEAVLVGGGSRLRGLPSYMTEQLHIPVSTLGSADTEDILGTKLASMGVPGDTACLAAGMAFEGSQGRPRLDLRSGELAYKADLSFLRQKAGLIAAMCIVIMAFAVLNGFASHYRLKQAHAALSKRLALETTEAFGDPLSAKATLSVTKSDGEAGGEKSPLPAKTAYDILLEINSKLPARDKVTLDVRELDIKPGKITMNVGVKAPPEIDAIEDALKQIKCFKVSRGDTSVKDGVHETVFNINSSCM